MKPSLKKLKEDKRDLRIGGIIDLPRLEDIPNKLVLLEPTVVQQKNSDFCGAASASALSEVQEKVRLSFEWLFAVCKMVEGDLNSWGTDFRIVGKVLTKYGSIEYKDAPHSLETQSVEFLKDINNWDKDLFIKALRHRKASYIRVDGKYSTFDDIRAYMYFYHLKGQVNGVMIGVNWGWSLRDKYIEESVDEGFGHAMAVIGWDGDYLIVQNSAGEEAGDKGRHYIHRRVIDKDVSDYGAFMFIDEEKEKLEYHIAVGAKLTDNVWVVLFNSIKTIWNLLKNYFQ